jgi:2'-5' RNA ligase
MDQLSPLIRQLQDIRYPAFEMAITGFGTFPEKGRPKILWIGVADPEPLKELQQKIEQQCVEIGFEEEDRPFIPL